MLIFLQNIDFIEFFKPFLLFNCLRTLFPITQFTIKRRQVVIHLYLQLISYLLLILFTLCFIFLQHIPLWLRIHIFHFYLIDFDQLFHFTYFHLQSFQILRTLSTSSNISEAHVVILHFILLSLLLLAVRVTIVFSDLDLIRLCCVKSPFWFITY